MNRPPPRHRAAGLTLVEILIALLVISIGLLGVAGLHAMSLRNNYDALMRSHASVLVGEITDRMRANRAAVVEGGDYDQAVFGSTPAAPTGSSQAVVDVNQWKTTLAAQLPAGDGEIDIKDSTRTVTIRVRWGERGSVMTFQTQTEI